MPAPTIVTGDTKPTNTTTAGTRKSGWCITGHHTECRYDACTCDCHGREG